MITHEQQLAARNAAEGKLVVVRYHDIQPGFAHLKPQPMFNVISGDYAVGSTVCLQTLLRLGLRVEVVE